MTVVDQYDSMIMFSELVWVGTKEANPDEDPLPFPKSIFGKGKLQQGGSGGEAASTSTSAVPALKAAAEEHAGPGEADEDEAGPSRKSGRASAGVRKAYVEVDSDAEVIDGSSSVRKLSSTHVWIQLMKLRVLIRGLVVRRLRTNPDHACRTRRIGHTRSGPKSRQAQRPSQSQSPPLRRRHRRPRSPRRGSARSLSTRATIPAEAVAVTVTVTVTVTFKR